MILTLQPEQKEEEMEDYPTPLYAIDGYDVNFVSPRPAALALGDYSGQKKVEKSSASSLATLVIDNSDE